MEVAEEDGEKRAHNFPIGEPPHRSQNKNFDEVTDISCDLCGAAVPFEGFSKHLVSE